MSRPESSVDVCRCHRPRREGVVHDIDQLHPRDFGRILHHQMKTGLCATPCRQGQHVDAVEQHRSSEHLVAGLAHDDRRQGALTGTVRTHHCVDLAGVDRQGDPVENGLACDGGNQVADLESAHRFSKSISIMPSTTRATYTGTGCVAGSV